MWVFSSVVCLSGAVTGTAVFARTFGAQEASACIEAQNRLPCGFGEAFLHYGFGQLLLLLTIVFSAFFAFGWLVLPPLLFYSYLGTGITSCCVCFEADRSHAVYSLLVIILPAVFAALAQTLLACEAIKMSFSLFRNTVSRGKKGGGLRRMLRLLPFCAAAAAFSAALQALMRSVFCGYILT